MHNYGILINHHVSILISPILYKLRKVLSVSTEGQPEGSSEKEICMKYTKKMLVRQFIYKNENTNTNPMQATMK